MSSIHIIVGSMVGGTEYIAEAAADVLDEAGHSTETHLTPDLSEIYDNSDEGSIWLICTSTHGEGGLPDNIGDFAYKLETTDKDLSNIKFVVIGSGDSSYDTFCFGSKTMERLMKEKNAQQLVESLYLDAQEEYDPEEEAENWVKENISIF